MIEEDKRGGRQVTDVSGSGSELEEAVDSSGSAATRLFTFFLSLTSSSSAVSASVAILVSRGFAVQPFLASTAGGSNPRCLGLLTPTNSNNSL